jgi:pimeloyl-ACP methyl ester carboxylesterase
MAELLRPRLPAGPFLVFGASLGGLLGWALSERLPVLGLVTLGSLPARRFLPVGVERAPERLERLPRPLFRLVYRLRIRGRLLEEGLSGALVEELLADLPERDALVARLRAIRAWGLPPAPACPALWLRPQHDREAPWSVAEAAEALPGLGAETVPGGHRAWLTHPGPLVDLLEHFFRPWSAWPDRGAGVTRG